MNLMRYSFIRFKTPLMDRIRINTHVSVKQCSLCQGDTEYYCFQCQQGICNQCKKTHVIDLRTKDHHVTSYLERNKYPPKKVTCSTRPGEPSNNESPGVLECESHTIFPPNCSSVECSLVEIERRRYYPKIHKIRSDVLFYLLALLEGLRYDVQSGYRKVIIKGQLTADTRVQELKAMIDGVPKGDLVDRSIIQRIRMSRYIKMLEKFEHIFLKLLASPVKLLRFLKQIHNPQKHDKKSLKIVYKIMKGMRMTQTKPRRARKAHLLRMMFTPLLQTRLTVADVVACRHISCVTLDRVWVSDVNKLVLTDTTTGDSLHSVNDSWHSGSSSGVHAVNDDFELIYIDKDKNINKLSKDLKTTTTFIRNSEFTWSVLSLYCSLATGDLLVGMFKLNKAAMIGVYSNTGCRTQTIPQEVDENQPLFRWPHYITKNNNGDVVASDSHLRAVVVTSKEGRYRFSYEGPKSGSELWPRGICTDFMSNILVCDGYTKTVQMIDKDGEFLSYLLAYASPGPNSLSYDVNNHILFVGRWGTNKVFIYKSDNRYLTINGKHDQCFIDLINKNYFWGNITLHATIMGDRKQ